MAASLTLVAKSEGPGSAPVELSTPAPSRPTPQRFYGSVALDPQRGVRDATTVIQEVVQHFTGLLGAQVKITMEIEARLPDGTSAHLVRTVTENCNTLRFTTYGFEDE